MYELAELYYKTGRKEDCSKTCDNLVLWFQDGIYVEKAVKLKEKLGVTMTNTQKKILSEINARKSDEEANKERLFMEQKELARLKRTKSAICLMKMIKLIQTKQHLLTRLQTAGILM